MNRIKELRLAAGLTQAELADRIDISRSLISKYEQEQIDLNTENIARLCRIFDVTADYLLGLSSQRHAQISDADAAIVSAYHAAPESVRQGIDALLAPYKEQEESAAG